MGPLNKLKNFVGKNKEPLGPQEFEEKGVTVVLKYNAHCKHCTYEMKKCCQNMKGVLSAELDEENPELITVKGVFEVKKLVAHIRRGADKIVTLVKEERAAAAGAAAAGGADDAIEEEEEEEEEIKVVHETGETSKHEREKIYES